MSSRSFASSIILAATLCFVGQQSQAQTNGSSFTAYESLAARLDHSLSVPVMECADLAGIEMMSVHITSTELENDPSIDGAYCTVRGVHSGRIEFVVNLPATWNGRLYFHGNGGYGGESIRGNFGLSTRQSALRHGFATAFTNLGHDAGSFDGASWAFNNREAEIDFSYRALHVSTEAVKSLIGAYYGSNPQYSYFEGCSTGGGQGLKAALRYPGDYDGIAIGAPVFDFVGLQLYGWNNQVTIADTPFSEVKVARLAELILERYDSVDGLLDGVINSPDKAYLSIDNTLTDYKSYFNNEELLALSRLYRGPVVDGKVLYPGVPVGAEPTGQKYKPGSFDPAPGASGWATRLIADESGYQQQRGNVETWLKYMAFEKDDPEIDIWSIDPERDLSRFEFMAEIMDVTSTDFSAFRDRGGRMVMYHGWADTGVNPLMTADYYERVVDDMGSETGTYFRTFMVPGMFHCRGGLGTDRFDAITPVVAWVELGVVPETILAARIEGGTIVRTRPLCPWPAVARYRGEGDQDAAENFICRVN